MGLDMVLWEGKNKEREDRVIVANWRKFNALHNWFSQFWEKNQNDINCQKILVNRDQLTELYENVRKSCETKKPYLIPVAGFFFGSTETDEYYWHCCETLVNELKKILTESDETTFTYSCWF